MEIVTKIAPIALALIMLGLGLGLTGRDFLRVINNPKDFVIGFFCQLLLLPIVAYILIQFIQVKMLSGSNLDLGKNVTFYQYD